MNGSNPLNDPRMQCGWKMQLKHTPPLIDQSDVKTWIYTDPDRSECISRWLSCSSILQFHHILVRQHVRSRMPNGSSALMVLQALLEWLLIRIRLFSSASTRQAVCIMLQPLAKQLNFFFGLGISPPQKLGKNKDKRVAKNKLILKQIHVYINKYTYI